MANDFSGDSNCKALWRMESGALTTDSKGTNTLTDNNTVGTDTVNYKEGAASADFEQANAEWLSITDGNLDSGFPLKGGESNKTILVCFWAKVESFASTYPHLFAKYALVGGKRSFAIATNAADEAYIVIGYNSGLSAEIITHASTLVTGRFYHFGVWFDDTDKGYGIRIWDDTAQEIVGTDKTGTATNNIYVSSTVELTIGSRAAGSQPYDGLMDEVVVFDAISADPTAKIDEIRAGTFGAGGTTYYQSVAGDIPAMSGIVAMSAIFSSNVAGSLPAPTGAISKLIGKGLSGSMPASSGTIKKLIKKGVLGNLPAAAGSISKLISKTFGGSMPAATGETATSFQTSQATAGILGALSGILSTVLNPIVSAIRIVKIIGSNFRKFLQ